jgi:hypothetical protein
VQYPAQRAPSGGGCHEGDGDGTLQGRGQSQAHFHFDQDQCEDGDSPTVEHQDSNTGTDFHSTQIQSVTFDDRTGSVAIAGLGVDNGKSVAFLVTAVDNGALPLDLYSITLSDGYNLTGAPLTGTIQLH